VQLNVNNPTTFYIRFTAEMPKLFLLLDRNSEVYYFRYLDGKTPRIKFNVPDKGAYISNVPFEVVRTCGIEIPKTFPRLPDANRDRWKPIKLVYNPEMKTTTPVRIFTDSGVVEYGPRFMSFIKPVQTFLIEHEKGHFFYSNEEDCDLYALVNFLRMGYNQSTAYYTLRNVLSRTDENIKRLKIIFSNIQKIRQQ
jgi:hypothetical protein